MSRNPDVIIVGGGPAGCVLAARLTEDSARRVLLIEAGPDYGPKIDDWPVELHNPQEIPRFIHSWGFNNAANTAGHVVALPRGRVLGGSATINGCVWNRGSAIDYDYWQELGNPGWGFADLLPYFKKAESDPIGNPELHGDDGPVPVWRAPDDPRTSICTAVLTVCDEHGIPFIEDFNGAPHQFPSIARATKNIATPGGRVTRMNPAWTYLAMARERENLEIVSDTLVDRVLFEGNRAVGVLASDGREFRGGVVVLSAGTYQSPAILMRSGIGPSGHLGDLGIDVMLALLGVGESLMDHPRSYEDFAVYPIIPDCVEEVDRFFPYLIKARSSQVDDEIDLHLYHGVRWVPEREGWHFGMHASLQYARSMGRVRLTSSDPAATLDIDHNYFADRADLEAMCDGIELVQRLVHTAPLSTMLDLDRPLGDVPPRDRAELREWVLSTHHATTYHPSTTCKMGPSIDPMAVVNHEGCVHGIDGLRVVDASIMPFGPRGNLHFPIVAMAEKIADVMRHE
jgi:choline dehydrogenase-like flavoprotein